MGGKIAGLTEPMECYCVCHSPISSRAMCEHCAPALQVMKTQNEIKLEQAIDELEDWVHYNQHDLGEFGEFIRVRYVENGINELRAKLGIKRKEKDESI